MKIALGCDHAGVEMKLAIAAMLDEMGHEWKDFGTYDNASVDYPVYGYRVGAAVASGEFDRGILICGTGVGIGQAAAKVDGTFVCTCSDPITARLSRSHNDSNILSMGARIVAIPMAQEIAKTWLEEPFCGGERHARRNGLLRNIERGEEL